MTITNVQSGTSVHEVAEGIYRISTPVAIEGAGGFSFNQYLIADDEPLLFHTGPRKMFPLVHEAVKNVLPVERLRYIAFSHVEADECGSLNEWLAAAPRSSPLCGTVAALVSIGDLADRPPRALGDAESLSLGKHAVRWFDTPHLPHGWECGFLMEERTATLLCGDLFTQEAPIFRPSRSRTSSARARLSGMRWTISRTRRTHVQCSRSWPRRTRRRLRACMAAHGAATARDFCVIWPMRCPGRRRHTKPAGRKALRAPLVPGT